MPIRLRLALWYSALFAVALGLFGFLLYALIAQHLEDMIDEAIAQEADHLIAAVHLENAEDPSSSSLIIPDLDTFEASEVYAQVVGPDGTVLAKSSNLGDETLPLPAGDLQPGDYPLALKDVRLTVRIAPVQRGEETLAWVQVAGSYRQRDMVLDWLRLVLIGSGLGAATVAGLLSGALTGRALRPVSEMIETAQAIAVSRGFSRRLPVKNPNDELGQLAHTFNSMLASLEEAYAAQQRFTADASHELRAPLTAIRGNLDLLGEIKDMPEEERQRTLTAVRKEVERLSRLVSDLLTLARADEGQSLRTGPVELDALVVETHHQARAMADGIGVRLGHLEPAVIQGDEDRLRQLLLILLDNALSYTPTGGTVTLWLHHERPWVTLRVEDTGIGIEPADLPHIFERFWRADRARARSSGGTGLGLAIAKWIVDQHGGEVLVDSASGRGTRVTVRFPAA